MFNSNVSIIASVAYIYNQHVVTIIICCMPVYSLQVVTIAYSLQVVSITSDACIYSLQVIFISFVSCI